MKDDIEKTRSTAHCGACRFLPALLGFPVVALAVLLMSPARGSEAIPESGDSIRFGGETYSGGRTDSVGLFNDKNRADTGRLAAKQAAVVKSMNWLKDHQESDGSWGPDKVPMTSLALLTFLAHYETTSSKEYGRTVREAIAFLLKAQRDDGTFASSVSTNYAGDPSFVDAQGVATYAISEAYGMTKIPDLRETMNRALDVIVRGQQPAGLWARGYDKDGPCDLAMSAWQIVALKAGNREHADVNGLYDCLIKARAALPKLQDPATGFFGRSSSTPGGDRCAMTGVGVLCQQILGAGTNRSVASGLRALSDVTCNWTNPPPLAMHTWFFVTQARFQAGDTNKWEAWNSQLSIELPKAQNEDGSWPAPLGKKVISDEAANGSVYSTALVALTLQVHFRCLPSFRPVNAGEPRKDGEYEDRHDVQVEIL